MDQAFKLSRNNSAINTVRGEYYILTGQYTLALKAFQSAYDASSEGSPEQAQARLHVEQITAIVASQSSVNYAEVGEDSINVIPLNDPNESRPTPVIRRRKVRPRRITKPNSIKGPLWVSVGFLDHTDAQNAFVNQART